MKRLLVSLALFCSSTSQIAMADEYQLFMMAGPNNYTKASFVFLDYKTCTKAGQDWVKDKKSFDKGFFCRKVDWKKGPAPHRIPN